MQLHEKHLNFSEGKEYEKRKLKCMYVSTLWNDQSVSLNFLLVSVVYKVKIFTIFFVIFSFYIVARIPWNWKKQEEKGITIRM